MVGLPKLCFERDIICDACMKGKHLKSSFKSKNFISTSRPLELLHMDLCGPMSTLSLGGKQYILVIVNDFIRFTWTCFLAHKNDAFHIFKNLSKRIQNEKGFSITSIRSDHGTGDIVW